jgi:hypothetical protein
MSPALAYQERDLEEDLSPIQGLTTECARCDPDNPLAVPRKSCPECKGSGRSLVALSTIVTQIKESRLELLIGPKNSGGFGSKSLLDDYVDPDDCID